MIRPEVKGRHAHVTGKGLNAASDAANAKSPAVAGGAFLFSVT